MTGLFVGSGKARKLDRALWQALKDAGSYREWQEAAEALNASDARLVAWKPEPTGPYSWDVVQQRYAARRLVNAVVLADRRFYDRTAQLDETDRKWRSRESRNSAAYRELLMPVQARDVGYITKPELHETLWTGTKTAIEDYIAATVRGVKTVRKTEGTGAKLDDKNEWFKGRRMVLGRTALFLQGGSVFGLSHLGVMKALFEVSMA